MTVQLLDLLNDTLPVLHAGVAAELVYWTEAQLTAWMDEAAKKLADQKVFIVNGTISLVAGTGIYSAPTRHIATLYVFHNGKPLIDATSEELEMRDPSYRTTAGTPTHWYADKIGINQIGLYPVPNAAAVALASTAVVIYAQFPPNVDGFETVSFPVPAVIGDLFSLKAISEAYNIESDSQAPEIAKQAMQLAEIYKAAIGAIWPS